MPLEALAGVEHQRFVDALRPGPMTRELGEEPDSVRQFDRAEEIPIVGDFTAARAPPGVGAGCYLILGSVVEIVLVRH